MGGGQNEHMAATLGSGGDLHRAVRLPEGEDLNEWIAAHTVDLFHQVCMVYGTVSHFCTESSCAAMTAGPKYEYRWADGHSPIRCSAPAYVSCLVGWVQGQLDSEALFPSRVGVPFPSNFVRVARRILRRLFRVYAHIYHQHFSHVLALGEEAHLNTSFKHFACFVQEFDLVDQRNLVPLQELIHKLSGQAHH